MLFGVWFVSLSSLVAQVVKSLPAVQEAWVQSLGQKDPLEKETATHSSILAWEIPWTKGLGGPRGSMGSQRVMTEHQTQKTRQSFCPFGVYNT